MTAEVLRWPRHILRRGEAVWEPGRQMQLCKTCGAADEELATECPGYRLHADEMAAVRNGHLDYVKGGWQPVWRNTLDPTPRHK